MLNEKNNESILPMTCQYENLNILHVITIYMQRQVIDETKIIAYVTVFCSICMCCLSALPICL